MLDAGVARRFESKRKYGFDSTPCWGPSTERRGRAGRGRRVVDAAEANVTVQLPGPLR
jgi:hypothetical protein